MDVNINITLNDKKLPSRPSPMIEGKSPADAPKQNIEPGYDVTADSETYKNWSGKFMDYTVQEGDTLESLCKRFDIKPNELALLNKKQGNMISDMVNVGQRIKVPVMEESEIE